METAHYTMESEHFPRFGMRKVICQRSCNKNDKTGAFFQIFKYVQKSLSEYGTWEVTIFCVPTIHGKWSLSTYHMRKVVTFHVSHPAIFDLAHEKHGKFNHRRLVHA